jgi:hypothetical protein
MDVETDGACSEEEEQLNASAPSGIAQLRNSMHQGDESPDDMSIDEFIFSNMASPTDMSPPDHRDNRQPSAVASAIPIKMRKEPVAAFAPQSVPVTQHQDEFSYVQRHVRKTSIDERRVCVFDITSPVTVIYALLLYSSNNHSASQETCRFLASCTADWNYHTEPLGDGCGSQ